MKTAKTIEIEVCENCGNECCPRKCSICQKECCDRCSDMIHIHVERYSPVLYETLYGISVKPIYLYGTSVKPIYVKSNGVFCMECSTKASKALRECGMIEEQSRFHGLL